MWFISVILVLLESQDWKLLQEGKALWGMPGIGRHIYTDPPLKLRI
jgi:hypothetical protein